jgi:phosphatidylethanolamine/phosphatidyl-N-methylethanolamine N-methyltransferase
MVFGTKERACSFFSFCVFTLGLVRDYCFTLAIKNQARGPEHFPFLALPETIAFSYIISTIGSMFVFFSMKSLGIHGTYLGDYFGILKTERVTGFPFNVVEHPMYYGSTMCFLGTAIWYCSPVGVLLSAWVLVVYLIAGVGFEEEFTNQIYSSAAKKKKVQ